MFYRESGVFKTTYATDMALYPAADMSEGVVALWLSGEESAKRAEGLVARLGFPVARA